jgi:subtilase family protein
MPHTQTRRNSSSSKSTPAPTQAYNLESLEARRLLATGPWVPYAQLIGQDQAFAAYPYLNGSNQVVALVDRGVEYRMAQLGGGGGPGHTVIGGYNFRDNNYNILDDYGHGTGVAGIIAASPYNLNGYNQGVASGTHLLVLKQESSANIKAALDFIIQYHSYYNIQVVNLTDFISDIIPGSWNPSLYVNELKTLHDLNIFVVSPVGNGETFGNPSGNHVPIDLPAASPYVFGAGGVNQDGTMWPDGRRGAGLDLLAPSNNVTMTYYIVQKDSQGHIINQGYDQFDDNYTGQAALVNYAVGSSWASAYVAGTATLLKQINPAFTPDQISQILTQTGVQVADNENPSVFYPRLNVLGALNLGFQMADDPYFGNTNFATAHPLSFKGSTGSLSNLKFVIGHPDNWSFNVTSRRSVTINVPYKGAGTPFVLLFDQNQHIVAQIGPKGLKTTLNPGAYFVYVSSTATLPGTYSVTVSNASAFTPAVARPAVVRAATSLFATATPSADAATLGITAGGSDVLLGKNDTSVWA